MVGINVGDIFFFANGDRIEKHTCKGYFESEDKVNYVITPYGKIATLNSNNAFATFQEAKDFIIKQAEEVILKAVAQAEEIKKKEDNTELIESIKPIENEQK